MKKSINKDILPNEWKKAELVWIPKPGNGKNMLLISAYRPLCLLTSTSKLIEHLIGKKSTNILTQTTYYLADNTDSGRANGL